MHLLHSLPSSRLTPALHSHTHAQVNDNDKDDDDQDRTPPPLGQGQEQGHATRHSPANLPTPSHDDDAGPSSR